MSQVCGYIGMIVPQITQNSSNSVLHRLIYTSEAVGSTGVSLLSIAQILGVAERNKRRDHITSGVTRSASVPN